MCYVCKYVGHGITLSRYTAWYNVRVWRSACRLENHSILCYSIRRFTCVKSGVYTYLRQLRLNHVNERLSSRQCQKKSNWYGTRLRTAPVMQRIRMAAVPQLWAPCHEGVWRSGGIDPPTGTHWTGGAGVALKSRFVHCGEQKTTLPGTEHRFVGRKSCRFSCHPLR